MIIKDLFNNNKREVKDIFYMMALQGLSYIVPLLVLPYLMKVLGAEKFGYIGFSLAVAQYLMLLVDFGFNFSATKRIALAKDNPEDLNKIFSATVYAKLGLLALGFVLLLLISLIPQFVIYRTTMLVMFLQVIGQTFLFVFLFQGMGEVKWVSIFTCIAKLSVLPFTFLIVKSPDDYLLAAFLQGFVSVFAALISWIMLMRKKWVKFILVSWTQVKTELKESLPIFVSTASTSIYTACFILILGYFVLPQEVGQYSAVERIMRALCSFILVPTLQVFYPYVSRLRRESKEQALGILKKVYILTGILMGCLAVFLFAFSPIFISFLGPEYNDTYGLFQMMAILPVFIGLGGVAGQLGLLAIGDNHLKNKFKYIYILAGVIAIGTVIPFCYLWGMYGATGSLFLTEFWVFIAMSLSCKKMFH